MRILVLGLALALTGAVAAQEKALPKKKPAAKQVAHRKATPQQIRKFDELQKKRQGQAK